MGRIKKSIEINAPLEKCYRVLMHQELFPTFLKNVVSVRRKGDPDVWHWEVKGPFGNLLEWDLELDAARHDNRIISWHTVRNSDVAHSGAVTLEKIDDETTCLNFVVEHTPVITSQGEFTAEFKHPAKKPGEVKSAEQLIEEDLELLKDAIEGEKVTVGATPAKRTAGVEGEGI